jgi:hypothetical protein
MVWSRVFGDRLPRATMATPTAVNAAAIAVVIAGTALGAQQAPATAVCTISGTITGLGGPLPGVSITVRRDDTVRSASSTDTDGRFRLTLPEATYHLTAELTGFVPTQKEVVVNREERRQGADADAQGSDTRCGSRDAGEWARLRSGRSTRRRTARVE